MTESRLCCVDGRCAECMADSALGADDIARIAGIEPATHACGGRLALDLDTLTTFCQSCGEVEVAEDE